MSAFTSHLVLIPTYNTGPKVVETARAAVAEWQPIWVVVDGSSDGTAESLQALAEELGAGGGLRVICLPTNRGKGAAILHAARRARQEGFTHALCMDADGQHPADRIGEFMERSRSHPDRMILGEPVFGADAPRLRVNGRKISNFWVNLETLWAGVHDSLFGFRLYPLGPLVEVMEGTPFARRFDFDPEVAVRLCWKGVRPMNVQVPVRYIPASEGGVTQFRYLRDNCLLTWMHLRLMAGFLVRLPLLVWSRITGRGGSPAQAEQPRGEGNNS
ncbi:glycosyltransferase family 2 protein [soil metagenome]